MYVLKYNEQKTTRMNILAFCVLFLIEGLHFYYICKLWCS